METISYPLRIPNKILELAKIRAREEYIDKSTALRQMLYFGAEEYLLNLVESGRISIGKAAELLGNTIQDMQRLAEKHNIKLGPTIEQHKKSIATLKKLSR